MNIQGKNLIISADDFGISKLADVNILALAEDGKIDRVAVMMSPNLNENEAKRLMASGVKIDIHLHLIKDDSDYWTGNRRLKEGAAKRMISFVYNFMTGKSSSEKVALKWAIQIEKFREIFGRNPDGIGSHEYIHFFPPYMKAVLKLADKYEIPFVRMGKKKFHCDNLISKILNWQRGKDIKYFLQHKNVSTTDFMVSLDWFPTASENFWKNLPGTGTIEMVCHPEREEEFEILKEFLKKPASRPLRGSFGLSVSRRILICLRMGPPKLPADNIDRMSQISRGHPLDSPSCYLYAAVLDPAVRATAFNYIDRQLMQTSIRKNIKRLVQFFLHGNSPFIKNEKSSFASFYVRTVLLSKNKFDNWLEIIENRIQPSFVNIMEGDSHGKRNFGHVLSGKWPSCRSGAGRETNFCFIRRNAKPD